ncbi:hypothetical protein [Kutzneria kofuensis]|uniref:Uncharacterized protein n=1 Tax=Kutzneria kofuensis TaxID=103725 RepID=A0A7W9NHN2_9PSEU|nr:hypothetical protein [Kutzneria kofuensis]MBB5892401.1 hypothetical protein [Kutzneria kofuensis]
MADSHGQYYFSVVGGRKFRTALTVDPDVVDLYWFDDNPPMVGFEKYAPDLYIRHTPISETCGVYRVEWRCEYRNEPFLVTGEDADSLLVYYLGRSEPKARELGLTIEERFVATGKFPKSEVENLREVTTQVWPDVAAAER